MNVHIGISFVSFSLRSFSVHCAIYIQYYHCYFKASIFTNVFSSPFLAHTEIKTKENKTKNKKCCPHVTKTYHISTRYDFHQKRKGKCVHFSTFPCYISITFRTSKTCKKKEKNIGKEILQTRFSFGLFCIKMF